MSTEDRVLLVLGAWDIDPHKRWVFKPDNSYKDEYWRHLISYRHIPFKNAMLGILHPQLGNIQYKAKRNE